MCSLIMLTIFTICICFIECICTAAIIHRVCGDLHVLCTLFIKLCHDLFERLGYFGIVCLQDAI